MDGANPSGDLSGKSLSSNRQQPDAKTLEHFPGFEKQGLDGSTLPEDVRMVRTRAEFEELQRRLGTYQVIKESEEKAQRKWESDNAGTLFWLGAANRTGGVLQIAGGLFEATVAWSLGPIIGVVGTAHGLGTAWSGVKNLIDGESHRTGTAWLLDRAV